MTTLYQNDPTILNRKTADLIVLEKAFSEWLLQKCWLTSKPNKEPYNPKTKSSEWGNPNLLCTFKEMHEFLQETPGYLPCIIPSHAGLLIIDIDKIATPGESFPDWGTELARKFGSYCEVSQSGGGLHLVIKGTSLSSRSVGKISGCKIEFLTNHCVTLTGTIFQNLDMIQQNQNKLEELYLEIFPHVDKFIVHQNRESLPLSSPEIITLLGKAKNQEKFTKLFFDGDITAYSNDESSADFALVSLVAFYTQDTDQIFEIIKQSALYKLPGREFKWSRPDYRTSTIEKAIASCRDYYQPKRELLEVHAGTWDNPNSIDQGDEDLDISFPLDVLPKTMRDAVEETARSVQVDPAMAVIPALAIVALQIGKKLLVEEEPELLHHPSLFLVCAMNQVERKSEVHRRIIKPIKDLIEAEELLPYKEKRAEVKAHNDVVTEQIAQIKHLIRSRGKTRQNEGDLSESLDMLKNQLKELELSKQEYPAPPENWGDDITPQRLQQELAIHGGAFGLFSSEGRTIFHRILDKDDRDGASGKSIYTAATWGDDLERSRVGNNENGEAENCRVRQPALTIMTFIQLDMWEEFSKDKTMRLSGTLSRVCVARPPSRAGTRLKQDDDAPHNLAKVMPFVNSAMKIRRWKPEETAIIRLSKEAAQARREYYNAIEREVGPGGRYEDVADIAGRSCSITARIAGEFAALELAELGNMPLEFLPITENLWLRAQSVAEYFLAQAIDSCRMHGEKAVDLLKQKTARWLLKRVRTNPRILLSEMRKGIWGLDEAIQKKLLPEFERAGWIRKQKEIKPNIYAYEINSKITNLGINSDE